MMPMPRWHHAFGTGSPHEELARITVDAWEHAKIYDEPSVTDEHGTLLEPFCTAQRHEAACQLRPAE
jgi:hypothetical protein